MKAIDTRVLNISEARRLMDDGSLTASELTEACLARIEAENGRLHAVIETAADAMAQAAALDEELKAGKCRGPLHGIPVLIKDNVAAAGGMKTAAGSFALRDCTARKEAPIVRRLREAGAIILGKANMTEWANFISNDMPHGYSTRGGLTVNAEDERFPVSGSSSGSAVGVRAGFALAAVGTETDGSIIFPAACAGLVGIKPTFGLLPTAGILPIASAQDTAGPIAKTPADALIMLKALAGEDADCQAQVETARDAGGISNARGAASAAGTGNAPKIAVAKQYFAEQPAEFTEIIEKKLKGAAAAGVRFEALADFYPYRMEKDKDAPDFLGEEVLFYAFGQELEQYISEWLDGAPAKTLAELVDYNERYAQQAIPYGQEVFEDALAAQREGGKQSPVYEKARSRDLRVCGGSLEKIFAENGADALLLPHMSGCTVAARAGFPALTVPAGFSADKGRVGITLVGPRGSDFALLELAERYFA